MSNNNRSGARAFLGDFGKALLMGSPALAGMVGLLSPAAREARKDQSGFFPESGISEGLAAMNPLSGYTKQPVAEVVPEDAPIQEKVEAFLSPKDQWLAKTANSPAAQSGAFTDDQRWAQQLKHRAWKEKMGR